MRIKNANEILKRLLNKPFDTNQTDKKREQKLRREAAATGELKRKYDC